MGMRDSAPQNRNIDLHIEELVLDGFSVSDGNRITAVVQQELRRLLSYGELPSGLTRNGNISRLDGGSIQIERGATAEMTGKQIAQNLYRGLVQ
jgi:hypothetical protein